MDIKLKSNKKENIDNSENNINEEKKKEYVSKGILTMLISMLIITIASITMWNSYETIDKYAKKINERKDYTYFQNHNFENYLAQTTYVLYYNLLTENKDEAIMPSDIIANINKDTNYNDEWDYNGEDITSQIDSEFRWWDYQLNDELQNLNYFAYDKTNNTFRTNLQYEEVLNDGKIQLPTLNKSEYQFYINISFDENGNLQLNDIKGVNSINYIDDFNYRLENLLDYTYYDDYGYSTEVTIKPIKNVEYIYAVPNVLKYNDSISWGVKNEGMDGYIMAGVVAVLIIAFCVIIAALVLPIKRAKEMAVFKGLFKIPFEIWCIIWGVIFILLVISPGYLVRETTEGYINFLGAFNIEGIVISETLIFAVNFGIWVIGFGTVFFAILILKYIFNIGIKEYFKRRTIIGRIIVWIVRWCRKTIGLITSVDLSKKNNKLIIKLLAINAAILIGLTSIWFFGIPLVILYSVILFFVVRKYVDKISDNYSKLRAATSKIAKGKLDVKIEEDLGLFEPFKEDLEKIQSGFKKAVDEEVKSQKLKTDLISNVSHDLKTPLTAIITYADLLKDENLSEEKRVQYIETLDRKAQRLQVLIEDLFEMSKATSGNITLNIESVDVVSLIKQTVLELDDKINEAELSIRTNFPSDKILVNLDGQRTFRVFENLVINMTKYAMPRTRVYIDVIKSEDSVEIIMKNMSAEEITFNVDTIAERFVRGDESRNTEGSGLGLAIAKSFVELQGGIFKIEVDGDLFKVYIKFDVE